MEAGRLLLACLLLFAVFLGGSQIGRLSTEVRALAAVTGAVLVVLYLRNLPRLNDLTDRLVLAGLIVFLLTSITSSAPRASFEAATTALAYVAAFHMARSAFADERNRRFVITLLGLVGVVIGVMYLAIWGSVWLRWFTALGAGAPPFDLTLPQLFYLHQYIVGMLAVTLMPATIALARRPVIWPLGVIGTASCFLVAVMSGGRSVWLAGVCAGILALLGTRGVRISLPRWPLVIGALALGLIGLAIVAGPLWARLGNTYTFELRLGIWGTALSHWLDSVLVGFGPGSFARELAATGYYSKFSIPVPHGHNAVVQSIFEGGLVGLAGMGLVIAGVIVGAARARTKYWSAAAAMTFVAAASIFDNPTVFAPLVVLLIVWAALASPRTPAIPTVPRRAAQVASFGMATIVAVAVISTFVAAWFFDRASDAAAADDRFAVMANLSRAVTFDPSHPLYQRELGAWLGPEDPRKATEHLRTAVDLNPSDTQAVRALALLYARQGEKEEAIALTSRLVAEYGTRIESALTAAYVHAVFHDEEEMDSALVSAVRRVPWLTAAPEWKQAFPDADLHELLRDAHASWQKPEAFDERNLQVRVWLAGLLALPPPDETEVGLQLQSAVLRCRAQLAEDLSGALSGAARTDIQAVLGQVMYHNAFPSSGLDDDVVFIFQVRSPGLARLASNPARGTSPVPDAFQDVDFYDRIPLSPISIIPLPSSPGGMAAWLRDPMAAAVVGAPGSPISDCTDPSAEP